MTGTIRSGPRRRPRRGGRRAAACLAAVAVALVALACGGAGERPGESTFARLRRQGVARVGYANEAPYAYLDSASDRLTGEAPEIARRVLADLGVPRVEGVLTEFGALIPGLEAGRFDLIAAGMYIKPRRCREIDFSNPTYCIGEAFLVRRGNPRDLHSYRDVAASDGAALGVVAGAVELGYARKSGIPRDRIVVFPDAPSAVAGVQSGRVDAYGGTSLTVRDLLTKAGDPGLEIAAPFTDPVIGGRPVRGCGAFGFRRDEDELRQAFDRRLQGFVGTPAHLDLVRPFGFTRRDLPGDATATALCRGGV